MCPLVYLNKIFPAEFHYLRMLGIPYTHLIRQIDYCEEDKNSKSDNLKYPKNTVNDSVSFWGNAPTIHHFGLQDTLQRPRTSHRYIGLSQLSPSRKWLPRENCQELAGPNIYYTATSKRIQAPATR